MLACEFDHLIIGSHTLEQGAAFIEALLGVQLQHGGRHVAMGTHNRVLKLGARAYLEVIAIDPAAAAPSRPRWFGLDDANIRAQMRERPRLLTWAARTQHVEDAVKQCPIALGPVHAMERGAYQWRITIPDDGTLICLVSCLRSFNGIARRIPRTISKTVDMSSPVLKANTPMQRRWPPL